MLLRDDAGTNADAGDLFFFWRNAPSVIVGRNQNTLAEVNTSLAESRGVAVVRRRSGGGSVYHDLGNLNYTLVRSIRDGTPPTFADTTAPLVGALRELDIPAEFTGRNDLTAAGRKFSGNARYQQGNRVVVHGTFLVETDLDLLEQLLTPTGDKFTGRGVASVRSRVVNLRDFVHSLTVLSLAEILLDSLRNHWDSEGTLIEDAGFTAEEIAAAERLADERYRRWDWNIGHSPRCAVERSARWPDVGGVTVAFTVERGIVTQLIIQGDFFGQRDIAELEQRLRGTPHEHRALAERLATLTLDDYITGADPEAFLALLL